MTETVQMEDMLNQCASLTGIHMPFKQCFRLLMLVKNLTILSYGQCNDTVPYPTVHHNPHVFSGSCAQVEILIQRWLLPPLMLLCATGNILALLIYRLSYFDGSSSVHFLRFKALANLIFVTSRPLEVIHAWTVPVWRAFEHLFWHTRGYIMPISNICGTMSTWLTLLVTIETLLCVTMPFTFRQYCTSKITWTLLAITLIFSSCLNLAVIPTQGVSLDASARLWQSEDESAPPCWHISYFYTFTQSGQLAALQTSIYWAQMVSVVLLPTLAMLVCSGIIIRIFSTRAFGDTFSQRRKCVIRMTVSTTLSHLLLEGPALFTYSAAAIWGLGGRMSNVFCILNHIINLGSVVNATIPFFLFLLCSDQFRHMTTVFVRAQMETNRERRAQILAQAGTRISTRHNRYMGPERSIADSNLLSIAKL